MTSITINNCLRCEIDSQDYAINNDLYMYCQDHEMFPQILNFISCSDDYKGREFLTCTIYTTKGH